MTEEELLDLEQYYKDNRIPTHIFPYISQRDDWDCGVACMAMALHTSYWNVRKDFLKRNPKGISGYVVSKYIGGKELKRYPSLKSIDDFIGGDYILLTKKDKYDWGHYVVKDRLGNIYDPEDGIVDLAEYERRKVSFSIKL